MKIPVFVSCPTSLSDAQEASRGLILAELEKFGLEARALGRSDYPVDSPLREVLIVSRHCAGGLILGYSQLIVEAGRRKPDTSEETSVASLHIPTPWNHIEAGILFGLGLPLLVFCEPGISGGIFDLGTGDMFVHKMPTPGAPAAAMAGLQEVFLRWQARVREHYYRA